MDFEWIRLILTILNITWVWVNNLILIILNLFTYHFSLYFHRFYHCTHYKTFFYNWLLLTSFLLFFKCIYNFLHLTFKFFIFYINRKILSQFLVYIAIKTSKINQFQIHNNTFRNKMNILISVQIITKKSKYKIKTQ